MRSVLGRVAAVLVASGSIVGIASWSGSSAGATTEPPTTATTTTTTEPAATSTASPPAEPEVVVAPDSAVPPTTLANGVYGGADAGRQAPSRGNRVQVATTPPPPTTLPPAWALPPNSGEGRRVVYSKAKQRVWLVNEDGSVAKTHLVSGRRTWNQPTANNPARTGIEPASRYYSDPPAFYRVFSRSSYTCALKAPHVCWRYMVRFTKGPGGDNIGFHEIPTNLQTGNRLQSVSQLGTPLSAGCVRQGTSDARFMWNWAWKYTKVVVLA